MPAKGLGLRLRGESLPMKIVSVSKKSLTRLSTSASTRDEGLDRSGEGALNHFDSQAVEEALKLKEAEGEGKVVLVSMGPGRGARFAAQGAGHGRGPGGADQRRGGGRVGSRRDLAALAAALEKEGADLVLFGQQSSDSDGAVLWAAVADRLRQPVFSQVAELTVADGKVRGKRQTELGYDVIEAPLPAVIAVWDAINEPRCPSLKGIMGAKKKPQESLSVRSRARGGALGEAGSGTSVSRSATRLRGDAQRSKTAATRRADRRLLAEKETPVTSRASWSITKASCRRARSACSARRRRSETT